MARSREESREMRHKRVRKKVSGTPARPRLCFYRSLRYLSCQIVDDMTGKTLASATTQEKTFTHEGDTAKNQEFAKKLGELIAERAKAKGVEQVVFDRGGYKYHGRVKAFADAAREKGLVF